MDTYVTQGEGTEERDERLCTHVKEDGSLCAAWATKDGTGLCAGHGPSGFGRGRDPRAAQSKSLEVRKEAAEARQEAAERARTGLEGRVQAFLERDDVQKSLEARWLVILANGSDSDVIRLHKELHDRAYGTAVQRTKDETPPAVPELDDIERMSPEERIAFIRTRTLRVVGD